MATFGTFSGLDWDFRLLQHRASKLYGMHFLPRSWRLWSYRNRQAPILAWKERQHETSPELTLAVWAAFQTARVRAALRLKPRGEVEVLAVIMPSVCAASDAAEDIPRQGAGGFLLIWQGAAPARGVCGGNHRAYIQGFLAGHTVIDQFEQSMVLFALSSRAATFRARRGRGVLVYPQGCSFDGPDSGQV